MVIYLVPSHQVNISPSGIPTGFLTDLRFVPFRGYADAANQHPLEQMVGNAQDLLGRIF